MNLLLHVKGYEGRAGKAFNLIPASIMLHRGNMRLSDFKKSITDKIWRGIRERSFISLYPTPLDMPLLHTHHLDILRRDLVPKIPSRKEMEPEIPIPSGQNDWQTPVKTLPSPASWVGLKNFKLLLTESSHIKLETSARVMCGSGKNRCWHPLKIAWYTFLHRKITFRAFHYLQRKLLSRRQ